jgi:hypothetical protein
MSAVAPLLQAKRTWPGLTAVGADQKLDWIIGAVRKFENASTEDPIGRRQRVGRISAARKRLSRNTNHLASHATTC